VTRLEDEEDEEEDEEGPPRPPRRLIEGFLEFKEQKNNKRIERKTDF